MVLGLHIGHDASACQLGDEIVAVAEERVTRIKNYYGFPFRAIDEVLRIAGCSFDAVETIAIASTHLRHDTSFKNIAFFKGRHEDYSNTFSYRVKLEALYNIIAKKTFDQRLHQYLAKKGFKGTVKYFDHHLCHVASSYATYPVENAVMLSLDGGGDGINWSLYARENGMFKKLAQTPKNSGSVSDSPADVYANVTKFLGFKRNRHEGKLTGLAAYGEAKYLDYFNHLLSFKEGEFVCRIPYMQNSRSEKLERIGNFLLRNILYHTKMLKDFEIHLKDAKKEDVAASLQRWFENITIEFVTYYAKTFEFQGKNLLLSGGAFANVLLNQKIKETGLFQNVYVVPNMGDGGLALGAAYLGAPEETKRKLFCKVQESVYYGPSYTKAEVMDAVRLYGEEAVQVGEVSIFAAKALELGYIVGLFTGGMEYGPRALGARSILVNPKDKRVNDEVNRRLNRTEFMPFAPYMLDEDASKNLLGYDADDYSTRFMTVTYHVSDEMKAKAPAVVHVDGTARPQIVKREKNPLYYDILKHFKTFTGIPTLVNTSFNAHEEPIVMSPEDAIRSYKNGAIDILVMESSVLASKDIVDKIKNAL